MKLRSVLPLIALAPLGLLAACGGAVADPEATLQTVKDTETAQLQSLAAKDIDGVMRYYRDDAVMVTPGAAPASGTAAIRGTLQPLIADPNLAVKLDQGPGWAAQSGDLAVTTASGTLTMTGPGGAPTTVPMRSQTVWHKATGDTWKIVSEYTVELPAAGAAAEAQPAG
ncbi:YybH family protein [Altererythrobacter sp. B11]|uniref:YybH family protein n=1 Tax=Altererythrobacter sp. B11 TaxID=2060312 RepID=UPI0015598ACD|nr:DUF4440 domain-containing protein [Altererythrobacter sp. B11]